MLTRTINNLNQQVSRLQLQQAPPLQWQPAMAAQRTPFWGRPSFGNSHNQRQGAGLSRDRSKKLLAFPLFSLKTNQQTRYRQKAYTPEWWHCTGGPQRKVPGFLRGRGGVPGFHHGFRVTYMFHFKGTPLLAKRNTTEQAAEPMDTMLLPSARLVVLQSLGEAMQTIA